MASAAESKSELFCVSGPDVAPPGGGGGGERRGVAAFERLVQPCLAELLGTALFVFVGCVAVVGGGAGGGGGPGGSVEPALAHGLALAGMVAVFGGISGGHLNPAVSLSVALCGGMEPVLLGPYVLSQLAGSMVGAGLARAVSPSASFASVSGGAFDAVKGAAGLGGATAAEMLMTLVLTLVVCMGAVNARTKTPLAPLYIGLSVAANILAGGWVSGGCMNPARAFGPAVAAHHWEHHWVYWVGPLSGALLTGSLVRVLVGDRNTRVLWK